MKTLIAERFVEHGEEAEGPHFVTTDGLQVFPISRHNLDLTGFSDEDLVSLTFPKSFEPALEICAEYYSDGEEVLWLLGE